PLRGREDKATSVGIFAASTPSSSATPASSPNGQLMSFATFYAQGGLFMHVITMCTIGATLALLVYLKEGRAQPNRGRGLALARSLARAGLMAGALGTLFGFMELAAVLDSLDSLDKWPNVMARGSSISLVTLTFGIMCA